MTQQTAFPLAPLQAPSKATLTPQLALTLLGPSPAVAGLWTQLRRLAPYVRTLLLTGESDCGQEAVARLLLDLSPQNHRNFITLTAAEAESRLGRASGLASFPSDVFLYLPDVHRLSSTAQIAVLRLLRMRRSRPFTVVGASTEDLRTLVGLGTFSTELAEVLGAMRLALPSLKQRIADVPMLISQLVSTIHTDPDTPVPQISAGFLHAAMTHDWPGNLQELTQALTYLCLHMGKSSLEAEDLPMALAAHANLHTHESDVVRMVSLDTVMQEHIAAVLHACQGNKLRAAETLGISRSTLYRMLDYAAVSRASSLALAS